MKVASENIFGETVAIRVRAKSQADVVSSDSITDNVILIALIKGKPDGVLADLVLLQTAVVGRLKNEAVSAVATIAYEPITAHDHVFRKHDCRAGRVFSERVVFKSISVRIHVVQPIASVLDQIVLDARVVSERKINAVTRIGDLVATDQISFAIPLVNSVAAPICHQGRVAIFGTLADSLFDLKE